jgi:hypothetical protein
MDVEIVEVIVVMVGRVGWRWKWRVVGVGGGER